MPRAAWHSGWSDDRTGPKHFVFNRVLGEEMGAAIHVSKRWLSRPYRRHLFYDLTCGDGIQRHEGPWEKCCSPGLMAHHARFVGCRRPVRVVLADRAPATIDYLLEQLALHLPALGYDQMSELVWIADRGRVHLEVRCLDSRTIDFAEVGNGDFVVVNHDPNKTHDWALNAGALARAADRGAWVRSFTTMGCNAGGIKRLPLAGAREQWFGYIEDLARTVRRGQDLLVMPIRPDDAQWAYAVVTPIGWVDRTFEVTAKAFADVGRKVEKASLREDPAAFWNMVDELFLRKEELRQRRLERGEDEDD